ncbi:MAG TPA: hypothetical protein VFS65_00540 [Candidatus Saccharimonadales bacterium]|nr:hypothetical protein [Candidatus Saccharimonadales bacterium]
MPVISITETKYRSALAEIRTFVRRKPYSPKGYSLPEELAFRLRTLDVDYDIYTGATVWMTSGDNRSLYVILERQGVQLTFVEKDTISSGVSSESMSYKRIGQNSVVAFARPTRRPTYSTA